jgi:hypothetical protein
MGVTSRYAFFLEYVIFYICAIFAQSIYTESGIVSPCCHFSARNAPKTNVVVIEAKPSRCRLSSKNVKITTSPIAAAYRPVLIFISTPCLEEEQLIIPGRSWSTSSMHRPSSPRPNNTDSNSNNY